MTEDIRNLAAIKVASDLLNDANARLTEYRAIKVSASAAVATTAANVTAAAEKLAAIQAREAAITVLISDNVPEHEWDRTELRLKNVDGEWGEWIDLAGTEGASAYEIAVSEGAFEGTVQEWIASLKGEQGDIPQHAWDGTSLIFQNPDGSPGEAVDLKGETGDAAAEAIVVANNIENVNALAAAVDSVTAVADELETIGTVVANLEDIVAAPAAATAAAASAVAADEDADRSQAYAALSGAKAAPLHFATVANCLADTVLSYSSGSGLVQVGAGDIVQAQGFRYQVAASGASDHHITTAGGVKLYVLPDGDGTTNTLAFGAKADGTTDDHPATQAAIDAAIGTVCIPKGSSRLTDTLTFGTNSPSLKGVGKRYNAGIASKLIFDHAGDGVLVNGQSHIGTVFEDVTFERAAAYIDQGINVKYDGDGGPSNIVAFTNMNRCYVNGGASGIWLRGVVNGTFNNLVCQGQEVAGIHFYGKDGGANNSNLISFDNFNIYNVTGAGIRYEGTDCGRSHRFGVGSIENCGRPIIIDSGDIVQNIEFDLLWLELNANPMQLKGGRRITFHKIRNAQAGIDLIDPATFAAKGVVIEDCMGASITATLGLAGLGVHNFERSTRAHSVAAGPTSFSSERGALFPQSVSARHLAAPAILGAAHQSGPFLKNYLENWNIGGTAQWTKPGGVTAATDPLGGAEAWSIDASQTITGVRQNTIPDNVAGQAVMLAVWAKGLGTIELYNRGDGFAKRCEFELDTPEWQRLTLRYIVEDSTNDRTLTFGLIATVASAGALSIWRPGIYAGFSGIDGRPVGASGGFEGGMPTLPMCGERQGRSFVIYGSAAPATGTWMVGDKVINTAPAASGNIGWVCTTGGAPGTWKTYGAVAA